MEGSSFGGSTPWPIPCGSTILTVDNPTAARFRRFDGQQALRLPSHGQAEYVFSSRSTSRLPSPKQPYRDGVNKDFRQPHASRASSNAGTAAIANEEGTRLIAAGGYEVFVGGGQPATGAAGIALRPKIGGEQRLPR
jgi:hypothetical protein